jgi:hypothetical protein
MDRSRSVQEKLAKSVDTTWLKHASKSQRSLEGIEARAAARAEDFRGGTGALVTRIFCKQLDQGVNLYGLASSAEIKYFSGLGFVVLLFFEHLKQRSGKKGKRACV